MNTRWAAAAMTVLGLLSLTPGQASCADFEARPLQLRLAPSPAPIVQQSIIQQRSIAGLPADSQTRTLAAAQRGAKFDHADPSLRERAFQSMLDQPEQSFDDVSPISGQSSIKFRFHKSGGYRDLQRGYKDMCARVSSKIWDEPNGKRIKFDIAGKPGVAVVIPIR
jgi:hypothetical protein